MGESGGKNIGLLNVLLKFTRVAKDHSNENFTGFFFLLLET